MPLMILCLLTDVSAALDLFELCSSEQPLSKPQEVDRSAIGRR